MPQYEIEYRIYGKDIFEGESEDEAIDKLFNAVEISNWKFEIDSVKEIPGS